MNTPTPVLFLDLDGTVRHGHGELGRFVNTADDVVVFPEAIRRMRSWKDRGGRIIAVTNQGGLALDHLSVDDCREALERTVLLTGFLFDVVMCCSHHPAAEDPEVASCWCRKPSPGMVFDGLRQLTDAGYPEYYPQQMALMVGDRPEDLECATRAGVAFQWAVEWRAGA